MDLTLYIYFGVLRLLHACLVYIKTCYLWLPAKTFWSVLTYFSRIFFHLYLSSCSWKLLCFGQWSEVLKFVLRFLLSHVP